MRVLARIPAIDVEASVPAAEPPPPAVDITHEPAASSDVPSAEAPAPEPADPSPAPPLRRPAGRAGRDGRRRTPTFPLKSVVALGILAAAAWSVASWSEQQRLARHRQERLARISQAFTTQGTTR